MPNTVGFLGAGQLGEPMVDRLLGAGHDVVVYARREEVRRRLKVKGAAVADSVADLARSSDVLISCLFSDAQLRETGLGTGGFIANMKPGAIFVSHTTGTLPTLAALRDCSPVPPVVLDAPVSGTVDDIAAGMLTVLIGGPSDAVASVTPILAAYADPVVATGALGSALALKLINNLLFAANAQLLGSATQLGQQLGIAPSVLLSTLQVCSARSHAAEQAHRIGGMDRFAELAGPFLRKDIAACRVAAAEAGVELGLLGRAVREGPLALDVESATAGSNR
ncbi:MULTISPECIES: NAD(P)-dependent oxidoreductase [Mycobacterium avium complex (MAC)]|jgi:3-hydroxyisobutyrate dehydrogenase-like beta-hydroxyacid dehydrogenase|uniref:6-phosphogluconate dehydrogenase n=4 Tax=Mycobacterium avium complex (MAC) TaxID=120793 RepID=A0AAW5S3S5_MYCBC|nr:MULTISPECIES: NAD(P)-dependent oxidoreductase [Mycobacterium avium complex (MAC)]ETB18170.1 6-phosphogluconate dehydrogenase [Mycobacterium avium 09-5983]ETB36419.1 6-phosphogluconate dehydrogenase [Mycobacterium avium subsp. hominissuis 10-5606]ETZ43967.1 NAD binding domain of 6-phosphogluconate dehydrogenase family protein [Mycobacterium avium MAV_061107_1842]MBG0727921.1 NAD(P)-dependent oxidoreductase [Mycobacterium avium]MBZ4502281.1 NAD(P)-dependent oxidoreductase [Mycobacterium avium